MIDPEHITIATPTANGATWQCSCGVARSFEVGTNYLGKQIDTIQRALSFARASAAFHRINETLK